MNTCMLLEKRVSTMATFCQRLTALRLEKQVTSKEIALVIGVSEGTMSLISNGKVNVNKDRLAILAEYFDVDVEYLMGKSEIRRKDVEDIINNAYITIAKTAKEKGIPPEKLKRIIDAL